MHLHIKIVTNQRFSEPGAMFPVEAVRTIKDLISCSWTLHARRVCPLDGEGCFVRVAIRRQLSETDRRKHYGAATTVLGLTVTDNRGRDFVIRAIDVERLYGLTARTLTVIVRQRCVPCLTGVSDEYSGGFPNEAGIRASMPPEVTVSPQVLLPVAMLGYGKYAAQLVSRSRRDTELALSDDPRALSREGSRVRATGRSRCTCTDRGGKAGTKQSD